MKVDLDYFNEHGYVIVPGLIQGDLLKKVQDAYQDVIDGNVEAYTRQWRPNELLQLPGPSKNIPQLGTAHLDLIVAAGRQLMGDAIDFWYDQLIYKPAGNKWATPWHQDAGYWRHMGEDFQAVTAWFAVEDVDENMGCMRFVPGSHKHGIVAHKDISDENPINGALEVEEIPEDCVTIPLKAGDVSFHHSKTLHYTAGNTGTRDRKGLVNHLCNMDQLKAFQAAQKSE